MPNVGELIIQTGIVMRERDVDDHYCTEEACLRAYLQQNPIPQHDRGDILVDPGVGTGVYGKILREFYPDSFIVGVELNAERFPDPGYYDLWVNDDYLLCHPVADTVIGNPPYKHAEAFFWKAYDSIMHNGTQCGTIDFLLRLGFLGSSRRHRTIWGAGYKHSMLTVCSTRPSFTGDGKTYPTEFAFFRWNIVNGVCDQRGETDFLVFERD